MSQGVQGGQRRMKGGGRHTSSRKGPNTFVRQVFDEPKIHSNFTWAKIISIFYFQVFPREKDLHVCGCILSTSVSSGGKNQVALYPS